MTGYELLGTIQDKILNPIIQLLFAVALIIFLWGIFEFVRDGDSDSGREKGKKHIVWGIIGLTIMASAFGILNVIVEFVKQFKG